MRAALLIFLALGTGCSGLGYQGALGYRARQAALQHDAAAFPDLMAEAAETEPKSRLDNPKKTVLTHFLDLADDPAFLATVRQWESQGWVEPDMICPVYRAHFAAHHQDAPEDAAASAQVCLARARSASARADPEEVERCLLEAPFLIATATAALAPYLALATDPAEPEPFRQAVLRGLTLREGFAPRARWGVTATVSADVQRAQTEAAARGWARRLAWVLDTLEGEVDAPELALASARGAMEVEHVLEGLGESFVAAYAEDPRPARRDLAWGWVRAMKHAPPVEHLGGLGLWDPGREPPGEAFWYVCAAAPVARPGRLGPRLSAEGASMVAPAPLPAPECPPGARGWGPYPLEQVARAAAEAALSQDAGGRVRLRLSARRRMDAP
jgi:hypothetical protein